MFQATAPLAIKAFTAAWLKTGGMNTTTDTAVALLKPYGIGKGIAPQ